MIAYLDTCSILNLLQVNNDDEYINYLKKSFKEIKLAEIVFIELKKHRFENSQKEFLDNIIFNQLKVLIDYSENSDAIEFTKKNNFYCYKENGESYSVSYSLNHSRFGDEFGGNLLKTHFITDDTPAREDFNEFYNLNVIGQILDTIDLMTFFWLKQFISKNELLSYCLTLKQLYCKDVSILLIELKDYSRKFSDALSGKQKITITKLIEILSDINENTAENLSNIIKTPVFKEILNKNKNWKKLILNIQKSNFRKKIPYIEKRINDLEKVWSLQ
mgnify:CR=1 FL=1